MLSVVEILRSKRRFLSADGVSDEEIIAAENSLGIKFAPSYREYLSTFGIGAYSGHELTGLSNANRTNVVTVTMEEKKGNAKIPAGFYVIEQTNIDGIVIWQSESGEIFKTIGASEPIKAYDSLEEYLSI